MLKSMVHTSGQGSHPVSEWLATAKSPHHVGYTCNTSTVTSPQIEDTDLTCVSNLIVIGDNLHGIVYQCQD